MQGVRLEVGAERSGGLLVSDNILAIQAVTPAHSGQGDFWGNFGPIFEKNLVNFCLQGDTAALLRTVWPPTPARLWSFRLNVSQDGKRGRSLRQIIISEHFNFIM